MARKRTAADFAARLARVVACALGLALWAGGAVAQQSGDFVTLIADRLFMDGPDRLIAEGNVEAASPTARLRAQRVVYDRRSGVLDITGPMVLTDGTRTTMLADQAQLSDGMRRGLIQSARVVLDDQLQITAQSIARDDDRFTQMTRVAASSCEICAQTQTPLWEVRAARVVHDQEARQLYFDDAQFRLFGLPVIYLPRLRVPDPSLDRATGFLSPRFVISTDHGFGLRAPYFILLGADRDLTVTPFVGSKGTRALELRYRQAFASGLLELGGVVARDSLRPGQTRALGYARGVFLLPNDFRLSFSLTHPTDQKMLDDYGQPDSGLVSDVTVERIQREERIRLQLLGLRSVRVGVVADTLPNRVGQGLYERRMAVPAIGGTATIRAEAHIHARQAPLAADVRSISRLSLDLGWRRDGVLAGGVLAAVGLNLGLDHARTAPALTGFAPSVTHVSPNVSLELRWPWVKVTPSGAVHVIEPVAQVIWGRDTGAGLANDLSFLPELDEGNLFQSDRFAARDRREGGLRANLGLSWTREDPSGWSGTLTIGRVIRQRDLGQFSAASPLAGARSHWLVGASLDTAQGLTISNRALIGPGGDVSRNAFEMDWTTERFTLSTSLMRIAADPTENRMANSSEWRFEGTRVVTDDWTARIGWRYDIARKRPARAMAGLTYETECLRMEMGLERRFSTAANPNATTSFGLNLDVLGVGGKTGRTRQKCS
jgi:LPS-assembly protein